MDDNKLDERILSYFRRRQAMESLTNDERVRAIWSHWDERTPGRIDFIIKARLSWESKRDSEMDVGLGWIRPTPYDPVQAGPAFVLPPSPIHELGAGVPVEDVPEEEHDRASQALGVAAAKASFITDTLAFLTGFPAWWRPARIIKMRHGGEHPREDEYDYRRYWEIPNNDEMTSAVIDDQFISVIYTTILKYIWNIKDLKIRDVLITAISWQAQANFVQGLGRYVHYWASVELLANFFFDYLSPESINRTPVAENKQRILEKILD